MEKLKVGMLYTQTSKTLPYQVWLEESLGADVQLINSRSETVNETIDLLVLVGGADVFPVRYGAKPSIKTSAPNVDLEWWDTVMLPQYIQRVEKNQLAIFGICRGFQTLNVHFGGRLSQDIPQEYSTKDRSELVDELTLLNREIHDYRVNKHHVLNVKVNSLHHQGVCGHDLSESLIPLAVNKKHQNCEAFLHKNLAIAGVQYHPEEIWCPFAESLMSKILMCNEVVAEF